MKESKTVWSAFKEIASKANLSLRELGNEAGIEHKQVFRIEHGMIDPTLSTLKVIANALKISMSKLMDYE